MLDLTSGRLLMALRFESLDAELKQVHVYLQEIYSNEPGISNTVRGDAKMVNLGHRCCQNPQASAGNLTSYKMVGATTKALAARVAGIVLKRLRRNMTSVYDILMMRNAMRSTWLSKDAPVHR